MPDDNNGTTTEPSLTEILQFDPFENNGADDKGTAEGGNATAPPASESGEEKATGQEEKVGETARSPATPPAPVVEPPKPVSQADLESLIRQQTETIRAAVQPPKAEPAAASTAKFNLGVPEALTSALRSEDPKEFQAGVGAMINGIANHVWTAFQDHLEKQVLPSVPQMIERYVQTVQRQESVARDFYGKYPHLQIPELAPVVQQVGAQIAHEFAQQGKSLEWSESLRDAIAERLFTKMPFLRAAAAQTNGHTAPPARRAFSTGSGARPAPAAASSENEMMEMIFGPTRN